jgi:hypothetical protein
MARADWSRLTEFLRARSGVASVHLSWEELGNLVGAMPASAVDHYPAWWHGDRSHTRAWHAAGFEVGPVQPGTSVLFRKQGPGSTAPRATRSTNRRTAAPVSTTAAAKPGALDAVDARDALVIVPCSKRKARGEIAPSVVQHQPVWPDELLEARKRIRSAAAVDTTELLPAVERYTGNFYAAASSCAKEAARDDRLLILSGGYGVLDGREPIGWYERELALSDWPRGLLEQLIAERTRRAGRDVVCFAARTSDYARLLNRVPWGLPARRRVLLVTIKDRVGSGEVPRRLGRAFAAWWQSRSEEYPSALEVRTLV